MPGHGAATVLQALSSDQVLRYYVRTTPLIQNGVLDTTRQQPELAHADILMSTARSLALYVWMIGVARQSLMPYEPLRVSADSTSASTLELDLVQIYVGEIMACLQTARSMLSDAGWMIPTDLHIWLCLIVLLNHDGTGDVSALVSFEKTLEQLVAQKSVKSRTDVDVVLTQCLPLRLTCSDSLRARELLEEFLDDNELVVK